MEIVDYLNNSVYCHLGASPIHGVGVFALRDIPRGTILTDYQGGPFNSHSLTEEEFAQLAPEIQTLIQQHTIFEPGEKLRFDSPNCHQIIGVFMNHSETPNCDHYMSLRDIKKGEELTKDYGEFIHRTHRKTKEILDI